MKLLHKRDRIFFNEEFNAVFNLVVELIEQGDSIENALLDLKYSTKIFYAKLSCQQRLELNGYIEACKKYGHGWEFTRPS